MNDKNKKQTTLSFEFFPTKTIESKEKLQLTIKQLKQFNPSFISCTFGAGGSTRDGTINTIKHIMNNNINAVPHLSCVSMTKNEIKDILVSYFELNIKQIIALRGDIPSGILYNQDFTYANELISFIKEEYNDHFHITVAAYPEFHPESINAQNDIDNFINKCKAGADSAITQYFYNIDAYEYFVNEVQKANINIPIIPGIMPIYNFNKLTRFSKSCGAEIPRWLMLKLQSYKDDTASIRSLGLDFVTDMCDKLIKIGVPSLHFYTLNKSGLISTICERLGFLH